MTFYFGADYYPEHWPRERWETDAALMREARFNTVRLAEFAWILLEPEEGRFDFAWLDDALSVLHRQDLSVVLGTPTAAMPAWVKQKYPETLASSDGRHRDAWGVRKNNCFSSGTYRLLSERITRAMAERYGTHPAVIGWQIDNEFDGPVCRCISCCREFHVFLRERYTSIEALNEAWGTHFWGHRFSEWEEIPVVTDIGTDNPSLCLDWNRFQTWLQVRFQRDQVRILRQLCPSHFVTHNFMGFGNVSDGCAMTEDLDFAGFDSYPGFSLVEAPDVPYGAAAACDLTRGLKDKNFWILETTAGPTGWGEFGRNPRPGELRKTFFHHVAHGADGQLFFRWRTCTAGREQYWHGLLGHDGRPGRRYREAAQIGLEAEALAPYLEETTLRPSVAMIYDCDSRWATEIQPSYTGNDYTSRLRRYYDALLRAGANVDIIPAARDFSSYRVVIAPQLHVLPDETAGRLDSFVRNGGVLVADARTAVKTETNLCHDRPLPGLLADTFGIDIGEYESIAGEYAVSGEGRLAGPFAAIGCADWITPIGAQVLARYAPWHMRDFAAVTRHRAGRGFGWYVGAVFREDAFYDALIADVLETADVHALVTPPAGVEVSMRQGPEHALLFVLNHTEEPKSVEVPRGLCNLLTRQATEGPLQMDRFGVAVLLLPNS
jgi:beta-galactosidase